MIKVLGLLKSISPCLQHIELDKKRAKSCPDLLKMLECHTESTNYMIRFFKEPLIENFPCKECSNGLFKPMRMPRYVYEEVQKLSMPMPIFKQPEIGDNTANLQYLSFEDARKLPLTSKFQPSLETTSSRVAPKKKKTIAIQHLGASRCALAPNIFKLKNKSNFKIGIASKVRGVVGCIYCMKPLCI